MLVGKSRVNLLQAVRMMVLLLVLVAALLFVRLAQVRASGERSTAGPPNIIFIMVDALRADHVSAYGYERQTTPVLDSRVAAPGLMFSEATAVSSWTNPSNGAMLTSLLPSDMDTDWADLQGSIPAYETLLAEYLQDAGYVTAGFISSWYMRGHFGYDQGFEVYEATGGDDRTRASAVNELAFQWLDANEDRLGAGGSPLFLFLYYYDPHTLYDPPPPYDTLYDPDYEGSLTPAIYGHGEAIVSGALTLTNRDLQHLLALYDGDIRYWDEQFGLMLDNLQARGLLDHSLIVLSSDHGQMFGEHGQWTHHNSLYEEVLRVPLLFRYTGVLPAGQVISTPVDHLDVAPTVLELAGVSVPVHMRGRSLVPLMMGQGTVAQRPILAEMAGETGPDGGPHWIAPATHLYAIKENGYKFIHAERLPGENQLFEMQAASVYEHQNVVSTEPDLAHSLWDRLKTQFAIPTEFLFLPVIDR